DYPQEVIALYQDGTPVVVETILSNRFSEQDRPSLHDLKDDAHASEPRMDAPQATSQYMVFSLADMDYAVPLSHVLEVGRTRPITPVPNLTDWILGVANVHGDIVSMISLRRFLGLPLRDTGPESRLLVVKANSGPELTTGLIVDRIRGIRSVSTGQL